MLRKLRRGSKEAALDAESNAPREGPREALPHSMASDSDENNPACSRLTFFDLPAELRNDIYGLVISDATLSLPSSFSTSRRPKLVPLKRRKSHSNPINGLLLASRQCRREYLSFLLSTISVVVEIRDFNFSDVMRVSSSLSDMEANALTSNRNLLLVLNTQNCSNKDLSSLRRWLDYRRNVSDGPRFLPWKYEFPLDRLLPPTEMGRVRLLRELEYYSDTLSMLLPDLQSEQSAELRAIIAAFERKAAYLEDEIGWIGQGSKSLSRNVRGLAGGGLI